MTDIMTRAKKPEAGIAANKGYPVSPRSQLKSKLNGMVVLSLITVDEIQRLSSELINSTE